MEISEADALHHFLLLGLDHADRQDSDKSPKHERMKISVLKDNGKDTKLVKQQVAARGTGRQDFYG